MALRISKEFKIGFIFILAAFLLVWGFSFLKKQNVFFKERIMYAMYQNVSGLETSGPIFINGVKVGQVGKVYFDPNMSGDIIVRLILTHNFPIPSNSVAQIFSVDLMGSKAVDIILGSSELMAQSGDTLLSDVEASLKDAVNQQILPLKLKAEDLLSSLDTMVVAIQDVFSKDIRDDLTASIRSIRQTFKNLESTTQSLDTLVLTQSSRLASIMYNIDMITRNLSNNSQEIDRVLNNLASISDTLAQADISGIFQNINTSVNNLAIILEKVDQGQGTLGMLIQDDKLYKDLEKSAYELNRLIEDIRLNPKRYVRFSVF